MTYFIMIVVALAFVGVLVGGIFIGMHNRDKLKKAQDKVDGVITDIKK